MLSWWVSVMSSSSSSLTLRMSRFWGVVGCLVVVLGAVEGKCPYHALWMPNSPYKLPEDHPSMKMYTHKRRALQQEATRGAADFEGKGVGTCEYVNPFTQGQTCVQMTGSSYEDETAAKAWCDAPGLPGAVGTFTKGGSCAAFQDENFAGVCVNDEGTPQETASAFVEVPGNALASCATTIMGCETFGGGTWVGAKCIKDEEDESMKNVIDVPEGSTTQLAEGECKLQAGIAGGGHMDMSAFWSSACANSNSSYSMPRKWQADTMTITTQKDRSVTVGHVWYDVENNRKREDSVLVEGDLNVFQDSKNSTFLHFGPRFYMIDWNEDGTHKCTIADSPVGILRPNWIIDAEGYDAVNQYLGTEYMVYEGKYRRVKKFRKTEPLEDAYMIQSFDDEEVWDTPEGKKRRPLNRQTPGAPFQGDAVNQYFNHSTDFSDDVFDIYKDLDCVERDFNRTEFAERQEQLAAEQGVEFDASAPGLNLNSSLHVDSGVLDVECKECDIEYTIRSTDGGKGEESPDVIEEPAAEIGAAESGGAAVPPGQSNTPDFEGSQDVNKEVFVEWKYHSANSTLMITATLDKDAWFSIAFPEIECLMEPAVSIIAIPDGDQVRSNRYSINSHAMSGIEEMVGDDEGGIPSFSAGKVGPKVMIEIQKYVEDFSTPLSVTWARGFDQNLGYHGGNGKGCLSIAPNEA